MPLASSTNRRNLIMSFFMTFPHEGYAQIIVLSIENKYEANHINWRTPSGGAPATLGRLRFFMMRMAASGHTFWHLRQAVHFSVSVISGIKVLYIPVCPVSQMSIFSGHTSRHRPHPLHSEANSV